MPPPGCAVADGYVELVAPTEASTGPLSIGLQARDGCDDPDPTFTDTVRLSVEQAADGRISPGPTVTFAPEDLGLVHVVVGLPFQGLTYVDVLDPSGELFLGGHELLVSGPERYPVIEALDITVDRGSYRASGVTADTDFPSLPLSVSVVVDVTEVLRLDAADTFEGWTFAPDTTGADHGFDLQVTLPPGRHSVCLYVDDVVAGTSVRTPYTVDCRVVEGPPPAPTSPFGSYDGLYRTPDGFVAAGWMIDPQQADGLALYHLSYGASPPGYSPRLPRIITQPQPAQLVREDVARAYPAYGAAHGFQTGPFDAPEGWTVLICIDAAGTRVLSLGCRSDVIRHSPLGSLDDATPVPGGARIRGWALDPDSRLSTTAHVYVDGRPASVMTADRPRGDVEAAFPPPPGDAARGYGPDHGFDQTLQLPAGRRTVCVYGIDIMRNDAAPNALLGCRDVVVPAVDPVGHLDSATPAPGGFTLRGWAADPDTPTTPLQVHTYRDGTPATVTTADGTRPDLVAVEGGRYGTAHGYTTTVPTGARARLCSYAINTGAGTTNTTLGCRELTRPLSPTGALDEATRTSPTTTTVRGWALDPDTASPVDVHAYLDGRFAGATTATAPRGDVAAAHPGWGAAHGYTLTVPTRPGQRLCTYAINTLQGDTNTTLGCRTT